MDGSASVNEYVFVLLVLGPSLFFLFRTNIQTSLSLEAGCNVQNLHFDSAITNNIFTPNIYMYSLVLLVNFEN